MSELLTITYNPKESCTITIDHYMDLVKKANDYDNLMELIKEYVEKKGERTKWIS